MDGGADFTAVDLLVSSALQFGRRVFPESALIDAYIARCQGRPAARRGQALDGACGLQGVREAA